MSRSTWTFSKNSWHYKLYQFWRSLGNIKTVGYKENLCHYWRCVMIWAPLNWFFLYEIHDIWLFRPFFILLALLLAGGLVTVFTLFTWTALAVAAILVGAIGVFGAIVAGCIWISQHRDETRAWGRKWIWPWAQYPCKALMYAGLAIGLVVVTVLEALESFIQRVPEIVWAIFFGVLLLGGFITVLVLWPQMTLIILGLTIVGAAAFSAIAALIVKTIHHFRGRTEKPLAAQKTSGMISASWEFAKAKKHRICPFIEFGEQ